LCLSPWLRILSYSWLEFLWPNVELKTFEPVVRQQSTTYCPRDTIPYRNKRSMVSRYLCIYVLMISEAVKYLHSYIITFFISLLNQIMLTLPKHIFVHASAKSTMTVFNEAIKVYNWPYWLYFSYNLPRTIL
jgi:hypothetical protein